MMVQLHRDIPAQARRMVDHQLRSRDINDPAVLDAMLAVPRHQFVAADVVAEAYTDKALPTSEGQTISQPYIVAKMTQALAARRGQRVLEVGTGSGYQAAILAHMGLDVTTIESHPALAQKARENLQKVDMLEKVKVVSGDGTRGYAPNAPYDRIIVTAAAPHLPGALRDQSARGARIVIPLGSHDLQYLTVLERSGDDWSRYKHTPCRFVPLIGADAWRH